MSWPEVIVKRGPFPTTPTVNAPGTASSGHPVSTDRGSGARASRSMSHRASDSRRDGQALPMWELLSECRLHGECSWVHTDTCAHISTHMHTSPRTHWECSTRKKGPSRLGFPEKLTGNATTLESNKNPHFCAQLPHPEPAHEGLLSICKVSRCP